MASDIHSYTISLVPLIHILLAVAFISLPNSIGSSLSSFLLLLYLPRKLGRYGQYPAVQTLLIPFRGAGRGKSNCPHAHLGRHLVIASSNHSWGACEFFGLDLSAWESWKKHRLFATPCSWFWEPVQSLTLERMNQIYGLRCSRYLILLKVKYLQEMFHFVTLIVSGNKSCCRRGYFWEQLLSFFLQGRLLLRRAHRSQL